MGHRHDYSLCPCCEQGTPFRAIGLRRAKGGLFSTSRSRTGQHLFADQRDRDRKYTVCSTKTARLSLQHQTAPADMQTKRSSSPLDIRSARHVLSALGGIGRPRLSRRDTARFPSPRGEYSWPTHASLRPLSREYITYMRAHPLQPGSANVLARKRLFERKAVHVHERCSRL